MSTTAIEHDFPFELVDEIAEIESFRKEINRPIYFIHKWWAKRLGSVFRAIVSGSLSHGDWPDYYDFQDFSSKVVLDPFMGSGTTLGEALKLGASVVGCDINPVSTFLVRQSLRRIDLVELQREFDAIRSDVGKRITEYYSTRNPLSGEEATGLHYFWVKVVRTPSGEQIPLFSSYVFSKNAYPKKNPEAHLLCPSCWAIFSARYDVKSAVCHACNHGFNPAEGPVKGAYVVDKAGNRHRIKELVQQTHSPPEHKLYAVKAVDRFDNRYYSAATSFDFAALERASTDFRELQSELPLPTMRVRPGHNTDQARGYNYDRWRDFFNERQLLCLGLLLKRIQNIQKDEIREHFVCLFSGLLEFNNLFCSFKGEGTGAVRHIFSHHILKPERTPLENNPWGVGTRGSGTFPSLYRSRLLKAKLYLDNPFEIFVNEAQGKRKTTKIKCSKPIRAKLTDSWSDEKSNQFALVLNGDSSSLPIPPKSVDAVITDPPYFDFIHYSELSDFFYAWLSKVLASEYPYFEQSDSSHENEVQDRDDSKFASKLKSVFTECHRVLKDDGVLTFSFHHSRIEGWLAIYRAIISAGFVIAATHPVKAEMSVSTPKSGTREPINIDAILVCKKSQSHNRISVNEAQVRTLQRIADSSSRLGDAKRRLSTGDHFVIRCAQAISGASLAGLGHQETQEFVHYILEKPKSLASSQ